MSLEIFKRNKAEVLSLHGKTQEDLDEDLAILKKWIDQEPHLPKSLLKDDNFLELTLIRNKYSIEKTKSKIENYCTLKGRYKYLFDGVLGTIKPREEPILYYYMEQLTEQLHRIVIIKVMNEEKYVAAREVSVGLTQRELTSRFDYNDGEIIICDYSECSAQFVTKWRINVAMHAIELSVKGFSAKMKEIHIINKWGNVLISFFRNLLPEKLRSRIHTHASIDTLKDVIPKKYLPKDYGGEQKSLREMQDDWENILEKNHDILKIAYETISDEDLRIEPTTQGLQGTFKQLTLD